MRRDPRRIAVGIGDAADIERDLQFALAARRHPNVDQSRGHDPHHELGELRFGVGAILARDAFDQGTAQHAVAVQAEQIGRAHV